MTYLMHSFQLLQDKIHVLLAFMNNLLARKSLLPLCINIVVCSWWRELECMTRGSYDFQTGKHELTRRTWKQRETKRLQSLWSLFELEAEIDTFLYIAGRNWVYVWSGSCTVLRVWCRLVGHLTNMTYLTNTRPKTCIHIVLLSRVLSKVRDTDPFTITRVTSQSWLHMIIADWCVDLGVLLSIWSWAVTPCLERRAPLGLSMLTLHSKFIHI